MSAPRRPSRGSSAARAGHRRGLSRGERRLLLVLCGVAGVLAVFVAALVLLRGGGKPASQVLIRIATPARTPPVAAVASATATAPPLSASPAPTRVAATAAPTTAPTPSPSPSPTPSPTPNPSPTPSPSPTPAPTPAPTPTPGVRSLPDLALQDFDLIPSGPTAGLLRVVIGNLGQADLAQQGVEIVAFDQTGTEVIQLTTAPLTIPSGSSAAVVSAYRPPRRTTITVVINPNHTIAEADAPAGFDDPNNRRTKTVTPP